MISGKKKVLFLIHDLGEGGAEKVLVNLVNNMDTDKFDITVMTVFNVGVNKQFLSSKVKYKSCFSKMVRGNSHLMKLFTPRQLHSWFIKEVYDIEISYLEGPCARIISGCPHKDTKKISWIHCTMHSLEEIAKSFRSKEEAKQCYKQFDKSIFVSKGVRDAFIKHCPDIVEAEVLYNTNESEYIKKQSKVLVEDELLHNDCFNWCGVGKLVENKGYDRMLRIQADLVKEGYKVHFFAIGDGPQKNELINFCREKNILNSVTFLGYQENPYKYVSKCDLYVCASHTEGFSTAATEALIVGTPVCTVEVSGMRELLGENNEYGIVTENDEQALYDGIKSFLDNPEKLKDYSQKAFQRGQYFSTEATVKAVEQMLETL